MRPWTIGDYCTYWLHRTWNYSTLINFVSSGEFMTCCLCLQAVANGIDSVLKIIAEKKINGVYGPLIDNFTCEDKYFTAVEVTAGNKYVSTPRPLCHSVVPFGLFAKSMNSAENQGNALCLNDAREKPRSLTIKYTCNQGNCLFLFLQIDNKSIS